MDSIDGVFEAHYAPPPADMPSAERQVVKKEGVRWEHSFYSAGSCYFSWLFPYRDNPQICGYRCGREAELDHYGRIFAYSSTPASAVWAGLPTPGSFRLVRLRKQHPPRTRRA